MGRAVNGRLSYLTTRLIRRPGTTISLTTSLPSIWRWTSSLSRARRSNSSSGASAAASISSRRLPLTWTTSVIVSLVSRAGSAVGQGVSQTRAPSSAS